MTLLTAVDVANILLTRHPNLYMTNPKLNTLIYYVQVESLRDIGQPLYTDTVEAWEEGPIIPTVHEAFPHNRRIRKPSQPAYTDNSYACRIVDKVAGKYGVFTGFDLTDYAHRDGGAWSMVYHGMRMPIPLNVILASRDMTDYPCLEGTLTQSINTVASQYANALKLLASD